MPVSYWVLGILVDGVGRHGAGRYSFAYHLRMRIDSIVFQTFRKLEADDIGAAKFADKINLAIDRRYKLHAKQLATCAVGVFPVAT
jgi:hypothetical protein